ncbi:cytohesin-2-like [Sinocyclocheilus grahami]|uniref:cytohesin-2-like n=1 Tax=Sinocyclocheilus grahami TaxID=75366 RepID=UPI0007AC8405|nr:PREDICTED: cytohesin-2-like [Sinocyclocheilus grahami]
MTFDSDTYMPKSKAPKMDDLDYIPADLSPEERSELEEIRRRKGALFLEIQRLKEELREAIIEVEGLESSTEGSKTLQKSRHVAMGRKKFNMDPKKGIVFLVENELLRHTSEDIAQFLYKGEGLNKTAIGDYLGERDDFNIKVLQAFVDLHEFTDLNLVQALRQFLWSFRLPGEAQKIDRMMEAFAQRYCHCNPGVFQSTDTCYVLSFSIIMLNTSLHNPNVRDKPTVERFISMNRGINDGGDLPEELLRIRCERGPLLRDACSQEETHFSKEERRATLKDFTVMNLRKSPSSSHAPSALTVPVPAIKSILLHEDRGLMKTFGESKSGHS